MSEKLERATGVALMSCTPPGFAVELTVKFPAPMSAPLSTPCKSYPVVLSALNS